MKLAAIGSNCVDYYQNMNGGTAFPGGGPVNMAVYTVRLGGKASYIGPVGNDEFGHVMYDAKEKQQLHRLNLLMGNEFLVTMMKGFYQTIICQKMIFHSYVNMTS